MTKKQNINTLATEILALIFKQTRLVEPPGESTYSETIVSHVCQRWRSIALDTSTLWTNLVWHHWKSSSNGTHMMQTYLDRSKSSPLTIFICLYNESQVESALEVLVPHAHRWRHFALRSYRADYSTALDALKTLDVPLLEYFSVEWDELEDWDDRLPEDVFRGDLFQTEGVRVHSSGGNTRRCSGVCNKINKGGLAPLLTCVRGTIRSLQYLCPPFHNIRSLYLLDTDDGGHSPLTWEIALATFPHMPHLEHLALDQCMTIESTIGDFRSSNSKDRKLVLPKLKSLYIRSWPSSREFFSLLELPGLVAFTLRGLGQWQSVLDSFQGVVDKGLQFPFVRELTLLESKVQDVGAVRVIVQVFPNVQEVTIDSMSIGLIQETNASPNPSSISPPDDPSPSVPTAYSSNLNLDDNTILPVQHEPDSPWVNLHTLSVSCISPTPGVEGYPHATMEKDVYDQVIRFLQYRQSNQCPIKVINFGTGRVQDGPSGVERIREDFAARLGFSHGGDANFGGDSEAPKVEVDNEIGRWSHGPQGFERFYWDFQDENLVIDPTTDTKA